VANEDRTLGGPERSTHAVEGAEILTAEMKEIAERANASGYTVEVDRSRWLRGSMHLGIPGSAGDPNHFVYVSQYSHSGLESVDFNSYVQLGRYAAVLDTHHSTVYAQIGSLDARAQDILFPDIPKEWYKAGVGFQDESRTLSEDILGCRVTLEVSHDPVVALLHGRVEPSPLLAMKLPAGDGVNEALEKLEKIGPSFCFDLECQSGARMRLIKALNSRVMRPSDDSAPPVEIVKPRNAYDSDALELYFEASGSHSPTTQYLLYYQVLESFFEHAVGASARDSVSRILRDPRFEYGGERQVTAIVASAQSILHESMSKSNFRC
jgi:hypothetical protein